MSYDIRIVRGNGTRVMFPERHNITGGTYALGGACEAWLNVTYNYYQFYHDALGEKGIRTIYGMDIRDAMPILDSAIAKLGDEPPDEDYWKATPGNARDALENLKKIAELALKYYPNDDMFWSGD